MRLADLRTDGYVRVKWTSPEILPKKHVPILMLLDSGYQKPVDITIVSGRYNPEYNPKAPWRDYANNAVGDFVKSNVPLGWTYAEPLFRSAMVLRDDGTLAGTMDAPGAPPPEDPSDPQFLQPTDEWWVHN